MSNYMAWKQLEAKVARKNPELAVAHAEAHAKLLKAERARTKNRSAATEQAVDSANLRRYKLRLEMVAIEEALTAAKSRKGTR